MSHWCPYWLRAEFSEEFHLHEEESLSCLFSFRLYWLDVEFGAADVSSDSWWLWMIPLPRGLSHCPSSCSSNCSFYSYISSASVLVQQWEYSVYFCVPESLQWHWGPISRVDYVSELSSWGGEPNHTAWRRRWRRRRRLTAWSHTS